MAKYRAEKTVGGTDLDPEVSKVRYVRYRDTAVGVALVSAVVLAVIGAPSYAYFDHGDPAGRVSASVLVVYGFVAFATFVLAVYLASRHRPGYNLALARAKQ